jgi:hypothetical protein
MKLALGRYRLKIALKPRSTNACPDRVMDGERTDRDLALLAQAEREFNETLWKSQSLLSGARQ